MFTTKPNFVASFAFALLGAITASIDPAFAGTKTIVPAPLIGAGLPAMAVLAGGYWLVRKLRDRR
jgi:uncharacterized membrane protein